MPAYELELISPVKLPGKRKLYTRREIGILTASLPNLHPPRKLELAMGATMPFSRYSTVDPSLMEAMRAAFYRVCEVLQLSCDREDPLTEVVVTKIVELAKAGENDPEILCFTVLAELGTPLQQAIPRSSPEADTSVVPTEADYG
jgi:hypothetical protein